MRFDLRVVKDVKGIKGGKNVVLGLDELNGVPTALCLIKALVAINNP